MGRSSSTATATRLLNFFVWLRMGTNSRRSPERIMMTPKTTKHTWYCCGPSYFSMMKPDKKWNGKYERGMFSKAIQSGMKNEARMGCRTHRRKEDRRTRRPPGQTAESQTHSICGPLRRYPWGPRTASPQWYLMGKKSWNIRIFHWQVHECVEIKYTNQSINQSTSLYINQSINRPVYTSINQSIDQSIHQSINQSTSLYHNQSINQLTSLYYNQSIDRESRHENYKDRKSCFNKKYSHAKRSQTSFPAK